MNGNFPIQRYSWDSCTSYADYHEKQIDLPYESSWFGSCLHTTFHSILLILNIIPIIKYLVSLFENYVGNWWVTPSMIVQLTKKGEETNKRICDLTNEVNHISFRIAGIREGVKKEVSRPTPTKKSGSPVIPIPSCPTLTNKI